MENFEQFNGILKNSALFQLLGETGMEELKNKLIEIIVEQIRNDLSESDRYIISPSDFGGELLEEMKKEIVDEVKQEYKDKVMKYIEKKIDLAAI